MRGFVRIAASLACALGVVAVICGAFGAHALQDRLTPRDLDIWEKAVRYQLFHALAMLVAARVGTPVAGWAAVFFGVGVLFFSGSLYALVLSQVRVWGAVTPIGGVAFILGWSCLAIALRPGAAQGGARSSGDPAATS